MFVPSVISEFRTVFMVLSNRISLLVVCVCAKLPPKEPKKTAQSNTHLHAEKLAVKAHFSYTKFKLYNTNV